MYKLGFMTKPLHWEINLPEIENKKDFICFRIYLLYTEKGNILSVYLLFLKM